MTIKISTMSKNSILNIYSIRKKIDLDPNYQRTSSLWNLEKKQLFIDSILTGYDVSKLYIHVLSKPYRIGNEKILYTVIDGKQKLETIWDFIDNKFPLATLKMKYREATIDLTGKYYSDLVSDYPNFVDVFDGYLLPIFTIKTPDDDLIPIKDMFSRLDEGNTVTVDKNNKHTLKSDDEILDQIIKENSELPKKYDTKLKKQTKKKKMSKHEKEELDKIINEFFEEILKNNSTLKELYDRNKLNNIDEADVKTFIKLHHLLSEYSELVIETKQILNKHDISIFIAIGSSLIGFMLALIAFYGYSTSEFWYLPIIAAIIAGIYAVKFRPKKSIVLKRSIKNPVDSITKKLKTITTIFRDKK